MKEEILKHLDDAKDLERLYRSNGSLFKREFMAIYSEIGESPIAKSWYERLTYESELISKGNKKELLVVVLLALVAGLIVKLNAILGIDEEFYYSRNIGFVVFPVLFAYFAWINRLSLKKIIISGSFFVLLAVFINLLPNKPVRYSDSCMHSYAVIVMGVTWCCFCRRCGGQKYKKPCLFEI